MIFLSVDIFYMASVQILCLYFRLKLQLNVEFCVLKKIRLSYLEN